MCGIAGIVGKRPDRLSTEAAMQALSHRGPDGGDIYVDNMCVLAHRRLAIIDLSATAAQPMIDPATGVAIVYNGELYNFRELRRVLQGPFTSNSDTEVVLRAYLERGLESVRMFEGMFAYAIWDPRDHTLHLVRDRFGIKPLFIHNDPAGPLAFASEAKALFAFGVPARPDLRSIHGYLEHGLLAHSGRTFFDAVESVPAAAILSWRRGALQKRRYWSPADVDVVSDEGRDVEAEAWELLTAALRRHLVADVPIGISLSSGLDSKLMLHALSKVARQTYRSYTFGFAENTYDEILRNEGVDFALPLERRFLRTEPKHVLANIEAATRFFECPLGGLGTFAAWRLMQLPREDGVPVLLSGEGADEAFGGYQYFYDAYFKELYEARDFVTLSREVTAFNSAFGEHLDFTAPAFQARLLGATVDQRAPDGTQLAGQGFSSAALREAAADYQEFVPSNFSGKGALRQRMLADLTALKIPKLLWFQDRASMAWGVEVRVPFLDHLLIEFAYRLPSRWLIRDGVQKYLLKRLLKRFCGVDYQSAQKLFVATPQREWLKGPLREPVLDYLQNGALIESGLIDFNKFRRAYDCYSADPELGNSFFVWQVLNLEALVRAFFPSWGKMV